MVTDISVAIIAAAFVVLVVFLIIGIVKAVKTLREINKTLHSTKKDVDELSQESLKLVKNLNETTNDIKKKLHAMDCLFKPFEHIESEMKKTNNLTSDIVECVSAGLVLYNKIKRGIKDYVK
jgi:uncharacterized protein YoxC